MELLDTLLIVLKLLAFAKIPDTDGAGVGAAADSNR